MKLLRRRRRPRAIEAEDYCLSWVRVGYLLTSLSMCSNRKTSFGNQGAAQAQNLRESGIPNEQIIIANRVDSYAEDAKSKGFNVEHDFPKAAVAADSEHCEIFEATLDDICGCSPLRVDSGPSSTTRF